MIYGTRAALEVFDECDLLSLRGRDSPKAARRPYASAENKFVAMCFGKKKVLFVAGKRN